MGQYTEHWAEYRRGSNRRTLQLLAFVLLLPLIALLGYGVSTVIDGGVQLTAALLLVWLIEFTRRALGASKVPCPRCSTVYMRGRSLVDCPKCGLRMLQDDPT
ncbi:MAG: hypothetical protein IPF98_16975 [Gemmatimonadetes bacterium]|nr:hypothetical protein [Gemmatimonadota bacterium]MCC6774682.1 hypothetical protein [Gemmatimonadaceae bacterium]